MGSFALKSLENELYSLRQQYQTLKDLVYMLSSESSDNNLAIKDWMESKMELVMERNEKVEACSDIRVFIKNVIKDTE